MEKLQDFLRFKTHFFTTSLHPNFLSFYIVGDKVFRGKSFQIVIILLDLLLCGDTPKNWLGLFVLGLINPDCFGD